MSLSFRLDPIGPPGWYTSGDEVKGTVVLNLSKAANYTKITVSLEAICYTSLDANLDKGRRYDDDEIEITYPLDEKVQVFPGHNLGQNQGHNSPENKDISYTLSEGEHVYPFSFVYPLYAIPSGDVGAKRRRATVLPPSLSDTDNNVVIQHAVIVRAYRGSGGMFSGSHCQTSFQSLVFLPSDIMTDENNNRPPTRVLHQSLHSTAVAEKLHSLAAWCGLNTSKLDHNPQCKAAKFELLLNKYSAVPGDRIRPRLIAHFKKAASIHLKSLTVELKITTSAKAANLHHDFEKKVLLYKIIKTLNDFTGGEKGTADILDGVMCTIPDDLPPTFLTQNIQRSYQILVDFRYVHPEGGQAVHRLIFELPITILSGVSLPDYQTGEVNRTNRTFEQARFYFSKYLG